MQDGISHSEGRRRQGIFWMLTVPHHQFVPFLPNGVVFIRGQLESGGNSGYLHWQLVCAFGRKCSIKQVKSTFGDSAHCELTRSRKAIEYVWKEETKVEGTEFELGVQPFERNSKRDWENIWTNAREGKLESIPADVRVVSYRTLRTIASDYAKPVAMVREFTVFWGRTGTGKSRRAWEEAGEEAYPKDPKSKFWCGYQDQKHVVLDEFRGGIDIAHLLRWADRYPVFVEVKGSSRPLMAVKFWITSNLAPTQWYPDADIYTTEALMRRLNITEFE